MLSALLCKVIRVEVVHTFSLAQKHPCQPAGAFPELEQPHFITFRKASTHHDAPPTVTTAAASGDYLNCTLCSLWDIDSMSERRLRGAGTQAPSVRPPRITRTARSSQQSERWAREASRSQEIWRLVSSAFLHYPSSPIPYANINQQNNT